MYWRLLILHLFLSIHQVLLTVKTTRSRFDVVIVIDQSKSMAGRAECETQSLIDKFHHIGNGKEDTRFGLVFCSAHFDDLVVPLDEGTNAHYLKQKLQLKRINRKGERLGYCFSLAKHIFLSDVRPNAAKVVFVPFDGIIDPDLQHSYLLENVAKPVMNINATMFVLYWTWKNSKNVSQQMINLKTLLMNQYNEDRLLKIDNPNFDIIQFMEQYPNVGKQEYKDCKWDWQDIPCHIDNRTNVCQKLRVPYEKEPGDPDGQRCILPNVSVTPCNEARFECPANLQCGIRKTINVSVAATDDNCASTKIMVCQVNCLAAGGKEEEQRNILIPVMVILLIILVMVVIGFGLIFYRRQQKGDNRSNSSKSIASRTENIRNKSRKSKKSSKKDERKPGKMKSRKDKKSLKKERKADHEVDIASVAISIKSD